MNLGLISGPAAEKLRPIQRDEHLFFFFYQSVDTTVLSAVISHLGAVAANVKQSPIEYNSRHFLLSGWCCSLVESIWQTCVSV